MQAHNERIEGKSDELQRLRRCIDTTVQVLTHMREKLQFVREINAGLSAELEGLDGQVAARRDLLSRSKRAREQLKRDNARLRDEAGMLGNVTMLKSFEAHQVSPSPKQPPRPYPACHPRPLAARDVSPHLQTSWYTSLPSRRSLRFGFDQRWFRGSLPCRCCPPLPVSAAPQDEREVLRDRIEELQTRHENVTLRTMRLTGQLDQTAASQTRLPPI